MPISKKMLSVKKRLSIFFIIIIYHLSNEVLTKDLRNPIVLKLFNHPIVLKLARIIFLLG